MPQDFGGELYVGENNSGGLRVTGSGAAESTLGYIGKNSGSTGTVTVSGGGASWKTTGSTSSTGGVYVGYGGNGLLTIENGGTVSGVLGHIGEEAGSNGIVTVTGPGSKWDTNTIPGVGGLLVGVSGIGTLNIEAGGEVVSGHGRLGANANSYGTAKVSGAGSLWDAGVLYVGYEGDGELTIEDGGKVASKATSGIGTYFDSVGVVTVTGTGSLWENTLGSIAVGDQGDGTLIIKEGGAVVNPGSGGGRGIGSIGVVSGSTGRATVTGNGSQWINGDQLIIGQSGNASLNIEDGGLVSNAGIGFIGTGSGSTGIVTVTGSGSQWVNGNELSVGYDGSGTLTVANGGKVSNESYANIGIGSGSTGIVTVTGSGSQWINNSEVIVGRNGDGKVIISNGGYVENASYANIALFAGSTGSVTVTGTGSQWINNSEVIIGRRGTGTVLVSNSGYVASQQLVVGNEGDGALVISSGGNVASTGNAYIANYAGSSGAVAVLGAGSTWTNTGNVHVGYEDEGTLFIANGGTVSNSNGSLGRAAGGMGSALVTGSGSQWLNNGTLTVGWDGDGALDIANGGKAVAQSVSMASNAGVSGTISIGGEEGFTAQAPGTLETETLAFGSGDGSLLFNHTGTAYVFDATLNNGADNAQGSGTGFVGDGLINAVAGRTILNSSHGDFTGTLQSSSGILQINGDMSGAQASILAGGTLEGTGSVRGVYNAGVIAPGTGPDSSPGGTLTITGDYHGNGGELHIKTALGNDTSPTDLLKITGNVSGNTQVIVDNRGGLGDDTNRGIKIIDIDGASPNNAFTLKGDYVTADGQQAVIGGAYAYTLQYGSLTDLMDGNWYLMSDYLYGTNGGQRYHPAVPLYEQYPAVLASLNTVPTLQQRVGNRYWTEGEASASTKNKTSGKYGTWARVEGGHSASAPARSTASAKKNTDTWKAQTGLDVVFHETTDGAKVIGGMNVTYGNAQADIKSPYGKGTIDSNGIGGGASLTWYGSSGLYVDGQAQMMWFDSDLRSSTAKRDLSSGNKGRGYALSAEIGKRYELGKGVSLTPQAQMIYSQVNFDSFTDPFDARVSLQNADSLRGRAGVSLDYETERVTDSGTTNRSHIYATTNLHNELLDGSKVKVSNVDFATREERLWAEAGLGGTYTWKDAKYAVFGEANVASSMNKPGDNYAVGGMLGFRLNW